MVPFPSGHVPYSAPCCPRGDRRHVGLQRAPLADFRRAAIRPPRVSGVAFVGVRGRHTRTNSTQRRPWFGWEWDVDLVKRSRRRQSCPKIEERQSCPNKAATRQRERRSRPPQRHRHGKCGTRAGVAAKKLSAELRIGGGTVSVRFLFVSNTTHRVVVHRTWHQLAMRFSIYTTLHFTEKMTTLGWTNFW